MTRNQKILVVDDSHEFVFLLTSLLKFHDVSVDSTEKPKEALVKIKEDSYALMITDYMMPEMNGLQLSQAVRQDLSHRKLKIILITAKDLDQNELDQINKLQLHYIKKPIIPVELYQKILSLLEDAES